MHRFRWTHLVFATVLFSPLAAQLSAQVIDPMSLSLEAETFEVHAGKSSPIEPIYCKLLPPCIEDCWIHRSGIFAEYLYLRARDIAVPYAESLVTVSGNPAPGVFVPGGAVGLAEPSADSGLRGGFTYALDETSSLVATYSWYEAGGNDILVAPNEVGGVVPGFPPAPGTILLAPLNIVVPFDPRLERSGRATAAHDIKFQLVDADFRWLWKSTARNAVNGIVGVRYADLDQRFQSNQIGANNIYDVRTRVDVRGVGLRVGLDAEQLIGCHGLSIYGRGMGNFLAGEVEGRYLFQRSQQVNIDPPITSSTNFEEHRLVSILELEAGVAWVSSGGRLRVHAGYTITKWFNALAADDVIQAAQSRNFNDVESDITFDGLAAGLEWRF